MTSHASGKFEVTTETHSEHKAEGASLARMSLSQHYHGGLEGSSTGEMLSATSAVEGSAGYVAMTRFSGSLDGRSGTFIFQHNGTMARGSGRQSFTVVPDSGTGQLAGLAGTLAVKNKDGKYFYDFEYTVEGPH